MSLRLFPAATIIRESVVEQGIILDRFQGGSHDEHFMAQYSLRHAESRALQFGCLTAGFLEAIVMKMQDLANIRYP